MKELIYIIALMVMTLNNTNFKVNIEESIKTSIQQEEQVESRSNFMLRDGTQYFYKQKDQEALEIVLNMLDELPEEAKRGVAEVHFEDKNGNVAGRTGGTTITLFDFMAYSTETQKYILFHEVGHSYANIMWVSGLFDLEYKDYAEVVKKDKNYLSDYSKGYIKDKNSYSEDFADAFAQYYMNNIRFKKKHPNRYEYLKNLMNLAEKIKII